MTLPTRTYDTPLGRPCPTCGAAAYTDCRGLTGTPILSHPERTETRVQATQ